MDRVYIVERRQYDGTGKLTFCGTCGVYMGKHRAQQQMREQASLCHGMRDNMECIVEDDNVIVLRNANRSEVFAVFCQYVDCQVK